MSSPVEAANLIAELEEQQNRLQFHRFTNDDAWTLGSLLVDTARQREHAVTVDIRRHGHQLFHAALAGTAPDNDSWIERKVRVVDRFNDSSYLVGRRFALLGDVLDERYGAEPLLYAPAGGSFPIIVRDVGVVGTITVSGLPEESDHALIIEVLTAFLAT